MAWHAADNSWTWFFDGGDVGLSASDVDAFALLANGHLLISLEADFNLAGLGAVDDADVLEFIPTVLGAKTAGTWSFYLHGAQIGLETAAEDIDGLMQDSNGTLWIGVKGAFEALGTSGFDEDFFRFGTSSWTRDFVGSPYSLTTANEDSQDGWLDPATGDYYFTTLGGFRIHRRDSTAILLGDSNDVIRCQQVNTNQGVDCLFTNFWDGSAHGMGTNAIDGLHIGNAPGLVETAINVRNTVAEPPGDDVDETNPLDGSEVPDELLPPATQALYLPMISK